MPEIILELSLNRSSGVLAGIVASLAQAGIELKSQKLQRAAEGRGGWLTITGAGDSPDPAVLAERLNAAGGVEKVMRVIVDGEAVLAEGKPLADQIRHDDLAELSAGSDSESGESRQPPKPPPAADRAGHAHISAPSIEDLPILSEPESAEDSTSEPGPQPDKPSPEIDADPAARELAAATGSVDESAEVDGPEAFAANPTATSDLADALRDEDDSAEDNEASTNGEQDDVPGQVGAVLRRRRRRRR